MLAEVRMEAILAELERLERGKQTTFCFEHYIKNKKLSQAGNSVSRPSFISASGSFTMFLKQIVREQAVPFTRALHPRNAVYDELMKAQQNGYQGRSARDVWRAWSV